MPCLFPRRTKYSIKVYPEGKLAWLVPIIFISLLAACTSRPAVDKNTLTVALGAEPVGLDPRQTTDANGTRLTGLIFNSLVRLGDDLKPTGDLAESWKKQGLTYTFFIKAGVTFHNGRPLDPDDIDFSFQEYRKPGGPFTSTVSVIRHAMARQHAGGKIEVEIELERDTEAFLVTALPAIRILPRGESASPDFSRRPVGTGAYRVESFSASEVKLISVRARTPRLHFKVIRDDFTRYQKLMNGEIDIAQAEIAYDKVKYFEAQPERFRVHRYPGLAMTYVALNFKDPLLQNREVRLALSHALDRAEIIRYKLFGFASEATSLLTPENPFFRKGLINPAFNVEAASKIISDLGLQKKPLLLKTSSAPEAVDNGRVLAWQMARTGLKVEVQSFEWSTFYDDVRRGRFQMAAMRWVGNVDPDIYAQVFHSREKPPGRNRGSYANPEADRLLDQALNSSNPEARRRTYDQVQKLVHDDLAMIPLWYNGQVTITGINVVNYRPSRTGDFRPFIETEKR